MRPVSHHIADIIRARGETRPGPSMRTNTAPSDQGASGVGVPSMCLLAARYAAPKAQQMDAAGRLHERRSTGLVRGASRITAEALMPGR